MSICRENCPQRISPYSLVGSPINPAVHRLKSEDASPSLQEEKSEDTKTTSQPPHAPHVPAISRSLAPNILVSLNERVVNTQSDSITANKPAPADPVAMGGKGQRGKLQPSPYAAAGLSLQPQDGQEEQNNSSTPFGERFFLYKNVLVRNSLEKVVFPDSVYTGTLDIEGHLTGYGRAEWSSGDTYEGEWLSDRMHGSGFYTWSDGDSYEGQYVNGYMCGFGVMKDAGSIYKGDWVDDMREGMGEMIYTNKDVYEGEWLAGMRHGRGKLVECNGNVYEGEFVRNEKQGKGILTKKNGDVYEGDFSMGMFNGHGVYIWADEAKYIGCFRNGLRHGEGREWHPNGEWVFGNFIYGKIDQQHQVLQISTEEDFVAPELPDNLEIAFEPLNPKQLRQLSGIVTKKRNRIFGIDSSNDFNETVSNINSDTGTSAAIFIDDRQKAAHDKAYQKDADARADNDKTLYHDVEERRKGVGVQDLNQEYTPSESRSHSLPAFPYDVSLPIFAPRLSPSGSIHTNFGVSITSMSFGLPVRQRLLSDKDLQDWRQMKIIGKGSFGTVYEALLTCGRTVCCKVVNLSNAATREDLLKLKNEISLMKRLYHTNIVQYYGCLKNKSDNTLNIFMEFVSGGSLSSFVKKFKKIPYETMRQWTYQMVCGVRYLHSCGIVHRDIKGDNVLITLEGIVKLADFGCSKHIDVYNSKEGCATMVGTPYWMAPEVIKCDARGYGTKSDIWSIGCTIVEMLTGRPPWPECHSVWAAVYKIANSNGLPTEIPKDLDPELMDLLEKCFERAPQKRPSAEELLQHPFLSEVGKDP